MLEELPQENIVIVAQNISSGGGAVLLKQTLRQASTKKSVVCIINDTFQIEPLPGVEFIRMPRSIFARLKIDLVILKNYNTPNTAALYFGNFPPLLPLPIKTYVFCQNRYIVGPLDLKVSKIFAIKVALQKTLFKLCSRKEHTFIVQTKTMAALVKQSLHFSPMLKVLPFTEKISWEKIRFENKPNNQKPFLYVASGEPHKNHLNLIMAWEALSSKFGLHPELVLILNAENYPILHKTLVDIASQKRLNVRIVDEMEHSNLLNAIANSVTIYPSLFESFGLPLVEANQLNAPIVASDREFVRDVCDPQETFDPMSTESIATAVVAFLNKNP
ncbi:glycosyltransferase [Bdellovibrio sp. KM01]|uniref:glycosyltransferase n=1 Tax=Bdellovibrio sp. KM01 TaxID=2748865 RepID=UPI0015EAC73F|nr:glycosyltransferase [Bdellovibrio sp. KM01]QLY27047.1 glycosyltransferase [Bdellovibrio sp. KM01]